MMTVKDLTQKNLIARRVRVAKNFFQRIRGLLGTRQLSAGEGLWIPECQGVHTFGMAYSLDVIYLDDDVTVIGLAPGLQPNLAGPVFWKAKSVLEFPAGTIRAFAIQVGDELRLEDFYEEEKLPPVSWQCLP